VKDYNLNEDKGIEECGGVDEPKQHSLFRLAPTRAPKGYSTLNIEEQMVIYALQQRPLNGYLNLEDAAGFSIYRVSLNNLRSI
jgi:hypothetical protein